jgi:hypothetical protein
MANYYYSGQGSLYLAKRSLAGLPLGFMPVGNVPELTINIETTKFEHKESESGSRLVDLTIIQEKKGTFEFKLENLILDNLAMSLWGDKTSVAGGSVATPGEKVYVPKDAVAGMKFSTAHPKITVVVVKDKADTITYVAGTDYIVNSASGSITLPAGSAILTAAAGVIAPATELEIHVSYTYGSYVKVDAFTYAAAPERWMRFEGINTVDNSNIIVDIFRGQFDPLTGYGLINEELASADMKGNILSDPLQTGVSKFFRQINL